MLTFLSHIYAPYFSLRLAAHGFIFRDIFRPFYDFAFPLLYLCIMIPFTFCILDPLLLCLLYFDAIMKWNRNDRQIKIHGKMMFLESQLALVLLPQKYWPGI